MRFVISVIIFFMLILSCQDDDKVNVDLQEIQQRGELRAITVYSATSYFIYRGKPMGYEYELLERLADHLDLELKIVIAKDIDKPNSVPD